MDQSTRKYIRRILALHVVLLVVVVGVVAVGARQVYLTARTQAEQDTLARQNLIARQTATGMESYFSGIVENLNLLGQVEEMGVSLLRRPARLDTRRDARPDRPGPSEEQLVEQQVFALAGPMWLQLRERTDGLIVFDTQEQTIVSSFLPNGRRPTPEFRALVDAAAERLTGITAPRVTPPIPLENSNETYAFVAVPAGNQRYHLMSAVRFAALRFRFLQPVSSDGAIGAALISEDGEILDAAESRLKGRNFLDAQANPALAADFDQVRQLNSVVLGIVERGPINLGGDTLPGAMLTVQPVVVGDRVWLLAMTRDLNGVDAVVSETFGSILQWALFVCVALVAILLSTAVTAIRGRSKLERLRTEMLDRELARLDEELEQARGIQLKWLPDTPDGVAEIGGIEIAAVNTPASHISGDFYNWFKLDDGRVIVVIGDVTGHGMAAAFLMATTQLLVRTTMARPDINGDVGKCMAEVNTQLCTQVYGGQFVTMLLCAIDTRAETVEIASAGHHAPLVCDDHEDEAGNVVRCYRELEIDAQLVLGVDDDLDFPTTVQDLSHRCRSMILYTDGVIEAANDQGERFDLPKFIEQLPSDVEDPRELADGAVAAVDRFAGTAQHEDDLTLVAIRLPARRPADTAHPPLEAVAV